MNWNIHNRKAERCASANWLNYIGPEGGLVRNQIWQPLYNILKERESIASCIQDDLFTLFGSLILSYTYKEKKISLCRKTTSTSKDYTSWKRSEIKRSSQHYIWIHKFSNLKISFFRKFWKSSRNQVHFENWIRLKLDGNVVSKHLWKVLKLDQISIEYHFRTVLYQDWNSFLSFG